MSLLNVQFKLLALEMNVSEFDCGDKDLNDFLKNEANDHARTLLAKTTVAITSEGQIAGYFALSSDAVRLTDDEKRGFDVRKRYAEYPAVKIGRMAIDKRFQGKGIGRVLIETVAGIARNDLPNIGSRFLTVDAYPAANAFYEKNGFTNNLLKNKPGRHTVSKRYDLLNPKP